MVQPSSPADRPVPALQHLAELRSRLSVCVLIMLAASAVGFCFRAALVRWLQQPLGQELFYTSPQGSFDFVVRLSLLVGLLITLPIIVYNLLRFVEPALPRPLGRPAISRAVGASVLLTALGAGFAYMVALPAALHFFSQVGGSQLHALITADRYFNFVMGQLATFAIIFHLPLVLLIINKVTPLGPGPLGRWRKFVIVGAFALALLMPAAPDPISQTLLALPLVILYEISIWAVRLANRRPVQPASMQPRAVSETSAKLVTHIPVRPAPVRVPVMAVRPAIARPARYGHTIDLRSFA